MPSGLVPDAEVRISDDLVSRLLAAQHPDLASLPLGERHEGWDNVTVRIGHDLAARLPRRRVGADLASREHAWLPTLAADWDFAVPTPVRLGEPGEGYPWSWSIVPYHPGERAFDAPLTDAGAKDLGKALAQVHREAPSGAPRNPVRSAPLAARAEVFDARINTLLDAAKDDPSRPVLLEDAARAAFEAGARAPQGQETWAHLDLHGGNVLSERGRLAAVLDWGDLGVGDPATDLGQALTLVGRRGFRVLVDAYAKAGGAAARRGTLLTSGSLREDTALRVEAEAVGYAVTLACFERAIHPYAGWSALVDLGYATPRD
ncbi:phosphotransferase [Demequina zhanjiangensis]|uniref:Phosphotransferase n=1 Tax=Demequina zhanjiangensis TaxID=3051659 RepID=A0ABT8FZI6_9MICO|nr:phosphotransferase [Demequina sp. SYSU T00b26]MDN4472304.1 phosphotransferase [Demequina sp. SYSU T00b26]